MTHALYLLDADPGPAWAPFLGARPLCELRAGAHLIRERWEAFVGAEAAGIFALPHLAGFAEPGVPAVPGPSVSLGGCTSAGQTPVATTRALSRPSAEPSGMLTLIFTIFV